MKLSKRLEVNSLLIGVRHGNCPIVTNSFNPTGLCDLRDVEMDTKQEELLHISKRLSDGG